MKKIMKKFIAMSLVLSMALAMNISAFAAEATNNVFCNFICAGQITGKTVPAGSNVVAPAVPVVGGFTFCGFDKSLKNITSNTTFTAIYVSDSLGKAAIEAKKASLPTPAISATTVANPNAVAPVVPNVATVPNTAVPQTGISTGVTTAANATPADMAKLLQLQQLILAQQAAAQKQPATATPAPTQAAPATAAPTQAAAPAQVATAAPAVPVAVGIPSWVVGLEGVDAAGAANAYRYLKNTKGLDDATIQANWGAFMHHYAGHGVAGW